MHVYAVEQAQRAPWPFQWAWVLLLLVPWVIALRDAIRHSEADFRAVGSSKTQWMALLLTVGSFVAVPYLFTVHRRFKRLTSPAS